jgi:hypothetical protein
LASGDTLQTCPEGRVPKKVNVRKITQVLENIGSANGHLDMLMDIPVSLCPQRRMT